MDFFYYIYSMLERIKLEVGESPGCYIYYNNLKEVIYVGKAKNLKKRMMSYFNKAQNLKTQKLVSEIKNFEFIITNTEQESLLLEKNLIKKYNPKYNILLKDDKSYPYIIVTDEKHPRLLKTRDRNFKATYYGPFTNLNFVNNVIDVIHKITKLRKCYKLPKEVCVYYHINQCYAPCVFTDDSSKYKTETISYLKNNMNKLKLYLEKKLPDVIEKLDFEKAIIYRDIINEIASYKKRQSVQLTLDKELFVINYYKSNDWISICVLDVSEGKLSSIHHSLVSYYEDYQESIISYLYSYFDMGINKQIVCIDENLKQLIKNNFMCELNNNKSSEYVSLSEIAYENAKSYYKNNVDNITKKYFSTQKNGYEELKTIANSNLNLVEVYDISHFQGEAQVGVKVSYVDGKKYPKLYRKYRIKTAKASDEYGSMRELLNRRISKLILNSEQIPDLIILDGGIGQVKIGMEILQEFGLNEIIRLIGLVKDDKHQTKAIINKNFDQFELNKSSQLYKYLYQMQEEVHRFAINYHKIAKNNSMFGSIFDDIEGVGKVRKKIIYDEFKSLDNMKNASFDDFKKLKIPDSVIKKIMEKLNS